MRKIEKTLLLIISITITAKIFRIPLSGPLIIFTLPLTGIIYIFSGWKLFETKGGRKNYFISTLLGIIYFIILIGILFKLQLWPNGQNIIEMGGYLGLGILLFLLINYLINKKSSNPDSNYFFNLLTRSIGIIGFGIIVMLIPVKKLITLYHPNDKEYVRLYMKAYKAENNQKYWKEFEEYRIRNIK